MRIGRGLDTKPSLYQLPKVLPHFWQLKTKPSKGFRSPKLVAHAQRAPQVLALGFNYAQLLITNQEMA